MNKVEVVAPMGVTIPADTILSGLDKSQVARRKSVLVDVKGRGKYRLARATQFKHGETFSIDSDVPKSLANVLRLVGSKSDDEAAKVDEDAGEDASSDSDENVETSSDEDGSEGSDPDPLG